MGKESSAAIPVSIHPNLPQLQARVVGSSVWDTMQTMTALFLSYEDMDEPGVLTVVLIDTLEVRTILPQAAFWEARICYESGVILGPFYFTDEPEHIPGHATGEPDTVRWALAGPMWPLDRDPKRR